MHAKAKGACKQTGCKERRHRILREQEATWQREREGKRMRELAKYVCQFVGNALLLTQNEYETREKRQRKEDMARFNPP